MTDIDALYREHRPGLVRLANSFLRDTVAAEDVVQEVFERLLTDEIRDPEAALSYLNVATVRRSLTAIRTQTRRRARHDRVGRRDLQDEPSAEDLALALDQSHRAEVADAIRGLSPQQRDALTLRYYGELSESQIAEAMQISRGAVKSHTSRARANLATALARPEPPPEPPVRRPPPMPVRRTPPPPTVPVPTPTPPRNRGIGTNVDHRAEFGQPLTPIEVDILQRLATGVYDDAIARALEMSVRNYRRFLTAAQRKLGARTRPHAVALAIAAGLIPTTREDTDHG